MRTNERAARKIKDRLYEIYVKAADAGKPTPSRKDIAEVVRSCETTIRTAEDILVNDGMITVDRAKSGSATGLLITIVATGKKTARNHGGTYLQRNGGNAHRKKGVAALPERKCLKCRRSFRPDHRGMFICQPCKVGHQHDRDDGSWLYIW